MKSISYLKVLHPAPILNRPDFKNVFGHSLLRDNVGVRALEFIALPESLLTVIDHVDDRICQVATEEYPCDHRLFADKKFCRLAAAPIRRQKHCPSKDQILTAMHAMLGLPYVWGGNAHLGVEKMHEWYPLPANLNDEDRALWLMKGVDCSGLLYDATQGFTPRNTSALIHCGEPVEIERRSFNVWVKELQPLDLIVWKGHVVIVFDKDNTIESRHPHGVILTPIKERFEEILQDRLPVNDYDAGLQQGKPFVIRRWI